MIHGFIILNYNSYDDSKKAIDSIYSIFDDPVIVVVDNCSKDDSMIRLEALSLKFDLVKTPVNLGYGGGNNFGFSYIKKNYDVDYLHILNPDIVLKSVDFKMQVENDDFYVLGPNVILESNNLSSSPIRVYDYGFKISSYAIAMKRYTKVYKLIMSLFGRVLNGRLEKYFNVLKSKQSQFEDNKIPVLSGCYLIFSKKYFEQVNFLYYPELFLYDEEVTMTYILDRLGHSKQIKYLDSLVVIHQHRANFSNWKNKVSCVEENFDKLMDLEKMSTKELEKLWYGRTNESC